MRNPFRSKTQRDPKQWAAYVRSYNRRWRLAVIGALGGRCVQCGFADERALQIDHVNGGGTKETSKRRASDGRLVRNKDITLYYKRVIRDRTGKYQLLCANCNWIKRSENKEMSYGKWGPEINSRIADDQFRLGV